MGICLMEGGLESAREGGLFYIGNGNDASDLKIRRGSKESASDLLGGLS